MDTLSVAITEWLCEDDEHFYKARALAIVDGPPSELEAYVRRALADSGPGTLGQRIAEFATPSDIDRVDWSGIAAELEEEGE